MVARLMIFFSSWEGFDPHFLLDAIDHLPHVASQRPLLDEDHRHAAPDIAAGSAVHQIAAMSVEANVHLRAAVFVVTGLRIGHLITGDDQGTLELHGRAAFLAELEGFGRGARRIGLGRKAEL